MEAYINDHILERAGLCISKLSFIEEFHNRPFLTKIEDAELQHYLKNLKTQHNYKTKP